MHHVAHLVMLRLEFNAEAQHRPPDDFSVIAKFLLGPHWKGSHLFIPDDDGVNANQRFAHVPKLPPLPLKKSLPEML